jgi:ubiquinone/menaquinone biosynthesis C-methylase UbiE
MGIYSRYVFPRLMHWTLSRGQFKKVRAATLAEVTGSVCEIGFGTGLNLAQYPAAVTRVTAVDPNPGMSPLAQRQIDACPIPVERHVLSGERLPLVYDAK